MLQRRQKGRNKNDVSCQFRPVCVQTLYVMTYVGKVMRKMPVITVAPIQEI